MPPIARIVPLDAAARPAETLPTDVELVGRILGGDHWASEALYRRHVGRVFRVVSRMLRHAADSEDATQDAFVDGLARLGSLRDPERVGRWLVGIGVHHAHRRLRRRRLLRMLGLDRTLDDEPLMTQVAGPTSPEVLLELRRIDALLATMGPSERACFVLRHLEGYSLEEVAELADCSLATVKRRLAAGRERLAAAGYGEGTHG